MNDFVLRGFCKKCGSGICMEKKNAYSIHAPENENWFIFHLNPYIKKHLPEPVWFLSARQIEIVFYSPVFCQWVFGENWKGKGEPSAIWLIRILNEEPFLVAKILRDAEKQETINNLKKLPKEYRDEILKEEP